MKANLGGTDVLKVLEKVAQCQPKPGQLRQILLLTGMPYSNQFIR
jgi:hypothetical protein